MQHSNVLDRNTIVHLTGQRRDTLNTGERTGTRTVPEWFKAEVPNATLLEKLQGLGIPGLTVHCRVACRLEPDNQVVVFEPLTGSYTTLPRAAIRNRLRPLRDGEGQLVATSPFKLEMAALTIGMIQCVHEGLRFLAAHDPDRAGERNHVGFNGTDTRRGHELAEKQSLTRFDAVCGRKLLRKYHRQLPVDTYAGLCYGAR